ncbi:hypothetical protein [Streptomyces sp. CB02959]|uniref:hypothetical protein n=1 Tax=unclassified Streptomyces TaxID=2593676 RepID=UPI002152EA7E|nr:hypothetical protein [Streptomyces sp. CB02959]
MAKHMLTALTRVLARALEDTPILVNAVDPGSTATHPVPSVAETAQRILLRPPPRRIGPLRVAWLNLAAE